MRGLLPKRFVQTVKLPFGVVMGMRRAPPAFIPFSWSAKYDARFGFAAGGSAAGANEAAARQLARAMTGSVFLLSTPCPCDDVGTKSDVGTQSIAPPDQLRFLPGRIRHASLLTFPPPMQLSRTFKVSGALTVAGIALLFVPDALGDGWKAL